MPGQKCPKCQKKMTPLSASVSLTNVHINHLCLTPKCYMAFTSDSTVVELSESIWHNIHESMWYIVHFNSNLWKPA